MTVYDASGREEKVTLSWSYATNAVLRVTASDIPGLPEGEDFAQVSPTRCYNATNAVCIGFTSSVDRVGYRFTRARNIVTGGVTNRVYTGTNTLWGTVWRSEVNGIRFRSHDIGGAYAFVPEGSATNLQFFCEWRYVSDARKRRILSEPQAVSGSVGERRGITER